MNLDFSDDQKMLRDQAHKFLSEKCTSKTVRGVLEGSQGYDRGLWKAVAEMGCIPTPSTKIKVQNRHWLTLFRASKSNSLNP